MADLLNLAIIWSAVFIAHICAHKTKLTPVLWFIAIGSVLVNIDILPQQPGVFITNFAEVGIIVIMFALGFEENSSNFIRSIKRSWGIALFGAVVPFIIAYFLTFYFWQDKNAALMCGLAMTATAVSLTMVILKAEKLHTTAAATGIMTSAVLDDIASLALVAILVPMATGEAEITAIGIATVVGKAAMFFVVITMLAMWLFSVDQGPLKDVPFINRFHLRILITMDGGEHATLTVLLLALLVALLGHEFGFHPAVGAYMAGLILKEEYFVISSKQRKDNITIHRRTHRIIESVAFSWIGPVFFVLLGSKLIFDLPLLTEIIEETILLTLLLFCGQIVSAGLAARFTGGFSWQESWLIGFGMLGRAELAFVVLNIAYIQNSIINEEMFYTLMITAFCLNVSVPICINFWKKHLNK